MTRCCTPPPVLLALLLCLASCAKEKPPSVILISLDTLRAGRMSLYGNERETTPYLEELARECLVYDEAQTVAPWTLISHVSMLTGLYPEQHGVVNADVALSRNVPFLAQRLKDLGYENFAYYKPGFIGERYGHDRGFDVFENHEEAHEALANMQATSGLGEGRPFFLFLHLFDIHSDPMSPRQPLLYQPPEPYDRMFHPDAATALAEVNFRKTRDKSDLLDESELDALVSLYDGGIRHVDDLLGEWIEDWRERGMLENTLLVITSDHGESLGQRGRVRGHGGMYQDGQHVPLMVRYPDGHRAGERESGLVSIVDIVPTVLEAVGLPDDERLPGNSLRTELQAERIVGASRPPVYARTRLPWKLIGANGRPSMLFNLEQDPLEEHPIRDPQTFREVSGDLEQDFAAVLAAHSGFEDAGAVPIEAQDAEMLKHLEALGYAGGGEDQD